MGERESDRPTIPAPEPTGPARRPTRFRDDEVTLPRIDIVQRPANDVIELPSPRKRPDPRRE